MRFSQEFIEKVREASNVVDVISQFTQLKRAGGRLTGLCPFPDHNEKTPSFSVSEDKQVYYCFGCKKSGNIYTAIQELQGMSFPEGVEYLASKASIAIPQEAYEKGAGPRKTPEDQDKRKGLWRSNELAAQFFHNNLLSLPVTHPMRQYCEKRGLSEEIIKQFSIGASLDDWEGLVQHFQSKNVPMEFPEKLGLVRARTKGKSGFYDLFRNRLMFAIVSQTGRHIGFGGRVLGDELPKYINSPESEVFNKGRIFYGLNETAKYIRTEDEAVIVEGYMDFIALYAAGIKNVVATLGTALTKDHARLLKRYTKKVVVLFDGDSAGQTAADRSLPILLSEGLLPRGCVLTDKQDPDDFINANGVEALKEQLRTSQELFLDFFERCLVGYRGTSSDKVLVMDKITPAMNQVVDMRLKGLYAREVAERLGTDFNWVRQSLMGKKSPPKKAPYEEYQDGPKMGPSDPSGPQNPAQNEKIKVLGPPKAELFLLNLALMDEELFKIAVNSDLAEAFGHQGIRDVFVRAEQIYGQLPNNFGKLTALLVDQVDPPEVISQHLSKDIAELNSEGRKRMFFDCEKRIRDKFMRTKTKVLASRLKQVNTAEQIEKLEQIMNIQRDRHNLGKSKVSNKKERSEQNE